MGWPGGDCCDEAAEDWRCDHYADLQGGLVCAVLDDLVIARYVTVDELLGKRPGPGRPPRLSDASWSAWPLPRFCWAVTATGAGCGSSGTGWATCSPMCLASPATTDRKSTRLNSSHTVISYAVFCLKKKKNLHRCTPPQKTKIKKK